MLPRQIAVLSASGGLDSTSLLLRLLADGCHPHLVSFRYGQKHALELEFLSRNVTLLRDRGFEIVWRTVDLSDIGPLLASSLIVGGPPVPEGYYEEPNMRSTVVPNRNAIFAAVAYAWALSLAEQSQQAVRFGLGVHSGDHAIYPDCRPEFFERLLGAFAVGNWGSERVEAFLPYLNCDKAAILRDALASCAALELDFDEIFRNTITSYAPDEQGRSSGLTGSDVERILAFDAVGRVDPLPYHQPWPQVVARARELRHQHLSNR